CYHICGDYAGVAQSYVQERHPSVQAMFMLGCAGDANPYPRGTMEMAREHGAALGQVVCRVLQTKLRPVTGPLPVGFDEASLPLQASLPRDQLEKMAADKRSSQAWGASRLLAILDRGEKLPAQYRCPLTVWQFSGDLTLV